MAVAPTRPGAAELDQQIVLRQRISGVNELGEQLDTWTDIATIWARVVQGTGRRLLTGGVLDEQKVAFTIRWRPDITEELQVVWDSRNWRIDSTAGTRRFGYMDLTCIAFEGTT